MCGFSSVFFLPICRGSCWTQKTTSILGKSGTAIVPPCWPLSRSTATPPSTWASWETSTPLCLFPECFHTCYVSSTILLHVLQYQLSVFSSFLYYFLACEVVVNLHVYVCVCVCVCVCLSVPQPRWPSQRSEWRHQPCWCHHHLRRSVHGREGMKAEREVLPSTRYIVHHWHLMVKDGITAIILKLMINYTRTDTFYNLKKCLER